MRGYGPRGPRMSKRLYDFWNRYLASGLLVSSGAAVAGLLVAQTIRIGWPTLTSAVAAGAAGLMLWCACFLFLFALFAWMSESTKGRLLWFAGLTLFNGCLFLLHWFAIDPVHLQGSWMRWLSRSPIGYGTGVCIASIVLVSLFNRLTIEARERRVAFQHPARPGL